MICAIGEFHPDPFDSYSGQMAPLRVTVTAWAPHGSARLRFTNQQPHLAVMFDDNESGPTIHTRPQALQPGANVYDHRLGFRLANPAGLGVITGLGVTVVDEAGTPLSAEFRLLATVKKA